MAELRWAESAVKDFEQICNYIAEDSEVYAKVFARKVISILEATIAFPYSGRMVPEMKNALMREKILNNYRLIYRVQKESIEVVRIIHSAKDFRGIIK